MTGRYDAPPRYQIPPRWLNCPRKSHALIGNKFLAFKAPLSSEFNDYVPIESRFTPEMLFRSMDSHKVKIGLWIDLTNTKRFYDNSVIESFGARYVKLQVKGHGECPNEKQVTAFVEICERFFRINPLDIIGVHCTHGFNRTGFMIASYFVLKEDWSCEKAIDEFKKARPDGIYKADYLTEFFVRYGETDVVVTPPSLPDWCFEDGEDFDEDEGEYSSDRSSNFNRRNKRRKEIFKKNAVFMAGVSGVFQETNNAKVATIQRRIQHMCGFRSSGFPGCQPVSMDKSNIQYIHGKEYFVSWKADGTRYMLFIDGQEEVYFIDRDNIIFHAPSLEFSQKCNLRAPLLDTLIDGEMVIDTDPGSNAKIPRYLVYDAIRINGKDVTNDNFFLRLERIKTDIIAPRTEAKKRGLIDDAKQPFSIRKKDFWQVTHTCTTKLLGPAFKQQLSHEPDGLIFQPLNDPYIPGRCDTALKWKPASHNSIDFKLKLSKETGVGVLKQTIGLLYVGQFDQPFAKIKYTKALKELDNKIVECKYENNQWVFMRERTDKSFPNSYTTATAVWNSIRDPVTEDYLLEYIHTRGFKKPDTELMPPPPKRLKA